MTPQILFYFSSLLSVDFFLIIIFMINLPISKFTNMNLSKLWEIVKDRGNWHAAVNGITKSQT